MQRLSVLCLLAVVVSLHYKGNFAKTVCKANVTGKANNIDEDNFARDLMNTNIHNNDYVNDNKDAIPKAEDIANTTNADISNKTTHSQVSLGVKENGTSGASLPSK
jgi:hypothetical protein